jgi:hypothetical protein
MIWMFCASLDAGGLQGGAEVEGAVASAGQLAKALGDGFNHGLAQVRGLVAFCLLECLDKKAPCLVLELEAALVGAVLLEAGQGGLAALAGDVPSNLAECAFSGVKLGSQAANRGVDLRDAPRGGLAADQGRSLDPRRSGERIALAGQALESLDGARQVLAIEGLLSDLDLARALGRLLAERCDASFGLGAAFDDSRGSVGGLT